jgi:putative transposase
MVEYKAARAGRHLVVIDRWYPSSKTCSAWVGISVFQGGE